MGLCGRSWALSTNMNSPQLHAPTRAQIPSHYLNTDTKPLPKHRDLHIDLRITDLESKIAQLEKKCRKEVQLNKKFAIRDKIRALKAELTALRSSAD